MASSRAQCQVDVQAHPGGAAAQCRFSGRCAIPIATTAPVDGSPLRKPDGRSLIPAGRTCQDPDAASSTAPTALPLQPARGPVNGAPSTFEFNSRWRFDLKTWEWQPIDGLAAEASTAEAATARSVLPAANEASAAANTLASLSQRWASAAASTKSKASASASTLVHSLHRTALVPNECALASMPNTAALNIFLRSDCYASEHREYVENVLSQV